MKQNTQHPKVAVVGAGSLFFGRQSIWQMVHSPHLNTGTLALVDTDEERMRKMARLAELVIAETGVSLKLEASTDRKEVLADADFVVLSFADRSVKFRGIDCECSLRYGIRMCSGDTIGPGGIFRTLREFPVILECCEDVRRLCPDAWVINYINPTAANGTGLRKYAPDIKSFALCDSLHMPHVKRNYALRAGIIEKPEDYTPDTDSRFDMRIAGVNHFTWLLKAEYDGRDVMPAIAEDIREKAVTETDGGDTGAKALFNNSVGYQLYEVFGVVPVCVGHTKEYLRYWQGYGRNPETVPPLSIWETGPRYERHDAMWKQVDDFISEKTPISGYMETFGPDHATDIVETMVSGTGGPYYINTMNGSAVSNMPEDAFLELCCDIDMDGPRPLAVGEMPVGLRGLQQQVLDTHILSADAAVTCDRSILRRAMLTDPLTNSIADTDALISDLLEAEKEVLPEGWVAGGARQGA
ncbi:MAG: glycoside hydrolase family 4 [Kiritimatiellia bacterium]